MNPFCWLSSGFCIWVTLKYVSLLLSCIGEGNGNPLQCSCLENPRDGGAWWAAVYGIAQSRTRLKRLSSSSWLSLLWALFTWYMARTHIHTVDTGYLKSVAEQWKTLGFFTSGGEEFNPGPVTRLDRSKLLCNKVLLKYKREKASDIDIRRGQKECPSASL